MTLAFWTAIFMLTGASILQGLAIIRLSRRQTRHHAQQPYDAHNPQGMA